MKMLNLPKALNKITSTHVIDEVNSIPQEDAINIEGCPAYSISKELQLLTMLNTLKLNDQFYRSSDNQLIELQNLIEDIASYDTYFVCQAIIYSRCIGEGMRSVNHFAAAVIAPFLKNAEYASRFYSLWNKKSKTGGCIFRVDDMKEIKDAFYSLGSKGLSSAMRRGFAKNIESLDNYLLSKYKNTIIDISNLVHPNSSKSNAEISYNDSIIKTIDAIMRGISVSADTWESTQTKIGHEIAEAIKNGDLTQEEAAEELKEAKADNWENLLLNNKLGIIAALRNIRSILKAPKQTTIDAWCELVSNQELIKNNLVLPIYFDLANTIVQNEFYYYSVAPKITSTLEQAYIDSIPNLTEIFDGKTAIFVDCSGSMGMPCIINGNQFSIHNSLNFCAYKAGLIAATIAKATNADIYKFGTRAKEFKIDINKNVFALASEIGTFEYGGTNPSTAFKLITNLNRSYDRIIFISDCAINGDITSTAYKEYIRNVCSPYIYAIDLAGYGTVPVKGEKVKYFIGYGPELYESIKRSEFKAESIIDEVRKIII